MSRLLTAKPVKQGNSARTFFSDNHYALLWLCGSVILWSEELW